MSANKVIFGCLCKVHALNNYTFSGSMCTHSTETNHQYSFRVNKSKKFEAISVFEAITLKRNEGVWPEKLYFCVAIRMFMSWTITDFLEVSGRVLSKVATNGVFRGKRTSVILNQKWRSATEGIHVFRVFL